MLIQWQLIRDLGQDEGDLLTVWLDTSQQYRLQAQYQSSWTSVRLQSHAIPAGNADSPIPF